MARAMRIVLALAVVATGFLTGGVILPVQQAEASHNCIWRNGHQYCHRDYWKGDCFYYHYDIYCRVYKKKKKYYDGGGYGSGSGY